MLALTEDLTIIGNLINIFGVKDLNCGGGGGEADYLLYTAAHCD